MINMSATGYAIAKIGSGQDDEQQWEKAVEIIEGTGQCFVANYECFLGKKKREIWELKKYYYHFVRKY